MLETEYEKFAEQFENVDPLPCPAHWGGYILKPTMVEFWQGRQDRLHDRFRYTLKEDKWQIERLAP
jgi:pyridoxamine 5'-phosphate oxidase